MLDYSTLNGETIHKYTKLRGSQKNYMAPPMVVSMMTGTKYAYQSHDGSITLEYTDGSLETRLMADAPDITTFDSYFAIVDWVQSARA